MSKALFVELEADTGREGEIADFLRASLEEVEEESETTNWYALRFGPSEFAIFDTFSGNSGRLKHLVGHVGRALFLKSFSAIEGIPAIRSAAVLSAKLPRPGLLPNLSLFVSIEAKADEKDHVAKFLKDAVALVNNEVGTAAWYALDFGGGHFSIFVIFIDPAARNAHLNGQLASMLIERASTLFVRPPEIRGAEILASKVWATSESRHETV